MIRSKISIWAYRCLFKYQIQQHFQKKNRFFDHCLIDQTWSKIPKIEKNWFLRLRFKRSINQKKKKKKSAALVLCSLQYYCSPQCSHNSSSLPVHQLVLRYLCNCSCLARHHLLYLLWFRFLFRYCLLRLRRDSITFVRRLCML